MNESIFLHVPKDADLGAAIDAFKASSPSTESVAVLIPAATVLRLTVQLPVLPTHKLQQAATYAVEERLAADIESQHLTIIETRHTARDRQEVEVAVVERTALRQLLTSLAERNLAPAAVYADADCIACKPGDLLLWIDRVDAHWITPQGTRRTWPVDVLSDSLSWALGDTPAGTVGLRVYASASDFEQHSAIIESLRSRVVSLQRHTISQPSEWLGEQVVNAQPRNLLHGEFQSTHRRSGLWHAWRWPIGIAVTMVAVFVAQLGVDIWMTKARAHEVEQRIAASTSALLPAGTASENVVPLLERQLAALGGRASASSTLSTLASLVAPDGASQLELTGLELQPGRIELELPTSNLAPEQLAALRASWASEGWQLGTTREADGITTIELVRP